MPTAAAAADTLPVPVAANNNSRSSLAPHSSSNSNSNSSSNGVSPPLIPPSPAPTTVSFTPGDDRSASDSRPSSATVAPTKAITRDIDWDSPATTAGKKIGRKKSVKSTGYYGEVFDIRRRDPAVPKTAGVCVELKTNVILENEFHFATTFSAFLANRYNVSERQILLTLDHSTCMIMGGSFEGTYLLTITSVSLISPTCNKRNAALVSDWLSSHLGVPAARGWIKFQDPDVANYASGGFTVLDLMEREELGRTGTNERTMTAKEKSLKRGVSRHRSRRDIKNEEKKAEREGDTRAVGESKLAIGKGAGLRRKSTIFGLFGRGSNA